jgi:superfamily II DNA or RNA helicase
VLATAYYQRLRGDISLDDAHLAALRPGQRGAVFAMRSWATAPDDGVAILGLPTGYGKSELIALAPFLFTSRRVLVIAPSVVVRHQLAQRVEAQAHLRSVGIIPETCPVPRVCEHVGRIESPDQWEQFEAYDVVVSHTQSVSPEGRAVVEPPDPDLFDLILFDEAHHLGAPSWVGVRAAFPNAVAVGFTATPYRRDRRALPGRTIFQYPLDKAVDERFFVPIVYREVSAGATTESRDRAVAAAALLELRDRDAKAGHPGARLLVRADTVKRAEELAALYLELDPEVRLEVITYETTASQLGAATERMRSGQSAGVAFVGVLGEGFDMPSLKIAAYHNPHRSLPVTIQFAGRVARTEQPDDGVARDDEHAVLIATANDHPEILAELHRDGQRWDKLIPELARELDQVPVRAWTVFSSSTASMADAFTVENFRTFILADIFQLAARPDDAELAQSLATLRVISPPPSSGGVAPVAPDRQEIRESVHSVKVLREGDCFAVLLARERDLQWLEETPSGQTEYGYLVFAIQKHGTDDAWWLCVRSTLPEDMTSRAIAELFGEDLERPLRSQLAQYRSDSWLDARFTGLGKRAIHPVVAGVMSYETGAGRNVDQALTLDDRALHEAGHAIGVAPSRPGATDLVQIGIAMNKRRVWQVGYARLAEYSRWAETVCRDLERDASIGQLGGLRVADAALDPGTEPLAAMCDPNFDPTWDVEYSDGHDAFLVRDLELATMRRPPGGDVTVRFESAEQPVATVVYRPDGQLASAPGEVRRHGRVEPLHDRLQRFPLSVFFDDGSVLRGLGGCITPLDDTGYFPISPRPRRLTTSATVLDSNNRFAVLDPSIATLPEKDGSGMSAILRGIESVTRSTKPASLFQFVVRQATVERADFIFCDDAKNEIADFVLGWRSHTHTGHPHVRLVHCKAMTATERTRLAAGGAGIRDSSVKEAQEISQQTLRSVSYLLLPRDAMVKKLESRAEAYPRRYVMGARETFEAILSTEPLLRTADIWMVHPGLSHTRLIEARGTPVRALLSSVRARAVDARADLAVLGRG